LSRKALFKISFTWYLRQKLLDGCTHSELIFVQDAHCSIWLAYA